MSDERCMVPVGSTRTGPLYCGNRAKSHDENERPICGVHRKGCAGISWFGERARYPEGLGGSWNWARGESRA